MPNKYDYHLKNGKTLTLEGDTLPSDDEVESIARENKVELIPADEIKSEPELNVERSSSQNPSETRRFNEDYQNRNAGIKPSYGPKTEEALSTPLTDAPSRFAKKVSEYIDPEQRGDWNPRSLASGMVESLGNIVSGMTSPREILGNILTAGTTTKLLKGGKLSEIAADIVKPSEVKPSASFLGYTEDLPLYNVSGGPRNKSTVSAKTLKELGIDIPETPPFGGEKLNGDQIRQQMLAARKSAPILPKQSIIPEIQPEIEKPRFRQNAEGSISSVVAPQDKLASALEKSKSFTEEQAALRTKELGERVLKTPVKPGVEGYYQQKAALKGEHTKLDFTPLSESMTPDESNQLFTQIRSSLPDRFHQISAQEGLEKLLKGQTPQASEVKLLEQALGTKIIDKLPEEAQVKLLKEVKKADLTPDDVMKRVQQDEVETGKPSKLRELWDLSKSLMSTDMPFVTSMAFRQSAPLVGTKNWFKAWDKAARAYGKEATYQGIMDKIESRPLFQRAPSTTGGPASKSYAQQIGLAMTDLKSFTSREETLRSQLAEKIPLYGRHIRASNRAATAFNNSLRADQLETLVKGAESVGLDPKNNLVLGKQIADVINDTTGRGKLAMKIPFSKEINIEHSAKILNDVMFSPRLLARNLRMLNPATYVYADPFVRKEYIKSALRTAGAYGSFAGLLKLAGAENSTDPNSADFLKPKIGNTRFDPGFGLLQILVQSHRMLPQNMGGGGRTNSNTGKFTPFGSGPFSSDRFDTTTDFFANKAHPNINWAIQLMKAGSGRPIRLADKTVQLALPMFVSSLTEIAKEDPELKEMLLGSGANLLGVGTQTYDKSSYKHPQVLPESFPDYQFGR